MRRIRKKIGMEKLGRFVGLIHGMGKATDEFAAKIRALTGAIFAYRAAEEKS